jgi:thymidylate kinase
VTVPELSAVTSHPAPVDLLVEFAGLPGVGKTTLAAHTRTSLTERGVACALADVGVSATVRRPVRVLRRLALASAQLSTQPSAAVTALRAVRSTGQESLLDAVSGVLQWYAVQRLGVRSRQRGGVHLLEEGQVQTLWSLTLRAGVRRRAEGADALSRLTAGLVAGYRPDLVVVVEAPIDQVSSRLGARASKHSRTQRLAEPRRSGELERGRRRLEEILERTGVDQLRLMNDGGVPPEELGRRAADWVLRSLHAHDPAPR